jgi:hypothetical protein
MRQMNRFLAVLVAGTVGLVVGGAVGALAGRVPVFHWELVPLVLTLAAMLAGLTGGAVAAGCGRRSVGGLAGAVGIGLLFAITSRADSNPVAITWWGVLVVAIAAVLAGLIGGGIRCWTGRRPMAGGERSRQPTP